MTLNLWIRAKEVLIGKFIAIQAYLKKKEKYQINNLILYLKNLKKNNKKSPEWVEGEKIIKIRAEINAIESQKIQKINENMSLFYEKINKLINA